MKRSFGLVSLVVIASMALAACGGAATPAPTSAPSGGGAATSAPTAMATSMPSSGGSYTCDDSIGCVDIAPDAPLKIAALQSISGDTASLGTDQVRAVQIAIDDQGGKFMGHDISLEVEDDGCNSEGGTTGAQKIVSDPQVVGIIGTSCSGAAVPASQIMSQAGLVMISGSNTAPALTSVTGDSKGPSWQPGYYRTAHNDRFQGRAAATFVHDELGYTKAASINDGDPYTEGLTTVFDQVFKSLGGDNVQSTAVDKSQTDMRPVLTSVAAAGAQVVYFPIFEPAGDYIVKQSKDVEGFGNITLMGADGLLSDTFVKNVGQDGVGMYFSGPATPSGDAYAAFVQKYQTKFGEKPIQAFHAHAYDAANMLFAALKKVAVQDSDGTLHIPRQGLRDALYATKDFQGLTGSLTCDQYGDCGAPKINIVRLDDPSAGIEGLRGNVIKTYDYSGGK
jgi:branched-chain amino acid transport system substrate-binding protein